MALTLSLSLVVAGCGIDVEGSLEESKSASLEELEPGSLEESEPTQTVEGSAGHGAEFSDVSTGSFHACGVRTDGVIDCWYLNSYLVLIDSIYDVAEKEFNDEINRTLNDPTVFDELRETVGDPAAEDLAVEFIEDASQTLSGFFDFLDFSRFKLDTPSGAFVTVSVGNNHTCGLKQDGETVCWIWDIENTFASLGLEDLADDGFLLDDLDDIHSMEQFSEVIASARKGLGIVEHLIEAGEEISIPINIMDTPPGRYVTLASGHWHSCGLQDDKTIECWMDDAARLTVAEIHLSSLELFADIAETAPEALNQVLSDESLELSSESLELLKDVLEGDQTEQFNLARTAIEAARKTIARRLTAPSGEFTGLSVGGAHSCGVRTDGVIACWGDNDLGELNVPSGQFTAVSSGGFHSCGLRVDGTVECWGEAELLQWEIPSGKFIAVTSGSFHSCGLRADGAVACWPELLVRAPATDNFISISAGGAGETCGVLSDNTIECWPEANFDQEELSFLGEHVEGTAVFVTTGGLGAPGYQIGPSGDRYVTVAWSPDRTRAVIETYAPVDEYGNVIDSPDAGMFVVNSDGTQQWRITPTGGNPSWSADSSRIAYADNDGEWLGDTGGFRVYVVNADGTGTRQLVNWGYSPAWSPSGTQLMYRIPAGPYSVSQLDGSEEWQIDYCGPTYAQYFDDESSCGGRQTGAWSPDGRKIAYTYGDEIHVVSADGTGARRLISGGEAPVWSPDGQWIAYLSTNNANETPTDGLQQLWVADAEHGSSEFLSVAKQSTPIVWSPDSTRLAYISSLRGSTDVIVVAGLESNEDPLLVSPPDSNSPTWSQDNTRIAFSSRGNASQNPEGDAEIFVVNADGTNLIQVTDNAYDDYEPAWITNSQSPFLPLRW